MMPALALERSPRPINTVSGALDRLGRSLLTEKMPLPQFIREAWPIIEPARSFISNWHIDCIAEHLEAVDAGQITRLMITAPPRMAKSNPVSVLWPAWSWTQSPWLRWIFASYAATLSTKHSIDRRLIIESDWYQERWGPMFALAEDQNQKAEFSNTDRGTMISTSVGGAITGKGADRIVIDDIVNPFEAESKAARESGNDFYSRTLSTRLDDPKTGAIVVVMQRLHKDDLVGHITAKEKGWAALTLPMVAEDREVITFPMSGAVHTREPGELLFPERVGEKEKDALAAVLGSRGAAAQLQQKPSDAEGTIFKREWWGYYRELPKARRSIWFWDTAAKAKEIHDFWAGIKISECADGYYLEHLVKTRMDYPTGEQTVKNEWVARPATMLLVEDKSTGQALIPALKKSTKLPIIAFEPPGDKVLRAHLVSPTCEAKKVFLPEGAPWVAEFVENMANFPDVDHDDDVDAFTGAMLKLTGRLGGQVKVTVFDNDD